LTERTAIPVDDKTTWRKNVSRLACLPVRAITSPDGPERDKFWNYPGHFYGEIEPFVDTPNVVLPDIPGMSGGPVLSIHWEGNTQFRYHLIAIQSSWLASIKTIRAVPINKALELLDAWLL
jgi:hypothetical protein